MISLNDARQARITKLRLDKWTNPEDHIEIHITADGYFGPWVKMWSPSNMEVNGRNPVELLIVEMGDLDAKNWTPLAPCKGE